MCPIGLKLQADRYDTVLNHIILFAELRNKLLLGKRVTWMMHMMTLKFSSRLPPALFPSSHPVLVLC